MILTITSVDYAPSDLYDQVPFTAELLHKLPGPDRPDYWLAALLKPLDWLKDNHQRSITHLVLAARWQNTEIISGIRNLPVAIAYVTDQSVLADASLQLSKCAYVAIGLAVDTTNGSKPPSLKTLLTRRLSNSG